MTSSTTQMSNRETEVTETSTQPQKSNKITSFFAKLVSWSSRDNLTNETKHNSQKKKRLAFFKSKSQEAQSHSSLNEEKVDDFGVAETETLQHFTRPKPPNRRRPRNTTKVTPILTDLQEEFDENDLEINQKVMKKTVIVNKSHGSKSKEEIHNEINENDTEETDSKIDTTEENGEEVILMRKNVMTELNRSLSSRLNGTKSLCQPTDQLKPKTKNNRPSDIFTQRLRSQNSNEGIENPTSL